MKGIRYLVFLILIGLEGISCSDKTSEFEEQEINPEEITIRLVVSQPHSGNNSYLLKDVVNDPETKINEIQVLVFEQGVYKYRVPGISITNTNTTTTFDARLLASDKELDLYIIANATSAVLESEPSVNATEAEVRKQLQMAFPSSGTFSFIPMFGHYTLPTGLQGNQLKEISGIKMLRVIARTDVLVGTVAVFELTSIQAFRVNNQIQLIPNQDLLTVTVPSIPANSRTDVNTGAVAVTENQSQAQLYLSEAMAPAEAERIAEATCIVVGGKYGGGEDVTYYRIDFDPNNTQNSFGQILRNHHYVFTIRSVAGPGWPTPEDAANNRSAQINTEVKAWDEATEDMYFDTEHYFGVSTREIILGNKQNAMATIQVSTDISDYTLQWADEQGKVSGTVAESLDNSYFKVEKEDDGSKLVVTALQNNSDNTTERTDYFVITANRWQILMTIRQQYTGVFHRTINLLSFRGRLGNFGVNLLQPSIAAETRGAGARGILANLNNFGPSGTVVCGGFNLLMNDPAANSITAARLAFADIVYFNYVANGYLATQDVLQIREWLETSQNRVLIVSFDGADVNVPILTEFLGSIKNINYFSSNTGPFPLADKSATNFFTDTGPFTVTPYTPVAAGFTFQNNDAYHGEIGPESAAGITPVLNGPKGGIVLGIDETRRIIYIGDVDINTASNGIGGTTTNHINNTTGAISNDAAKLIANVFAWTVGVVTKD